MGRKGDEGNKEGDKKENMKAVEGKEGEEKTIRNEVIVFHVVSQPARSI